MAIVINGSGTVTGISVGGLPDDIVDSGTLADNAVGLAQMASGTDGNIITYDTSGNPAAVATGSDGQVLTSAGADAVPAFEAAAAGGKILQVTQGYDSTAFDTTSSSVQAGSVSQTMTLNNSSNKILIGFTFLASCTKGASYSGARYSIYRGGDVSGTRLTLGTEPQLVGYDTETWSWQSLWYLDTPGGNTNYCLGFWSHPAGGNARIRGGHGYTTMTLMEIQV
jgi:hypothetical protein